MKQLSQTVTKALTLLDEFLDGSAEIGLSEMTARTGMHKTTILRLCASLEEVGFLEREPGAAYRLGPKIWRLAQAYRRNFRLEDVVRPLLERIRDATGESVSYYVRDGNERVCLFRENSRAVIRHHVEEGARLPLDRGVVGRVLMAFSGAKGTDFVAIRRDGRLIAEGREPHTTSVAVPVIDGAGRLAGALVVSGPTARFTAPLCEQALALIADAALALARLMPVTGEGRARPATVKPERAPADGDEQREAERPQPPGPGRQARSGARRTSPDRPPRQ
jgi:DNA-binding IclR family transcriptional regulator